MADLIPQLRRALPTVLQDAGEDASSRVIEFFTAEIRNPNTREAYARAAGARVVAVDISDKALALAEEVGASHKINACRTEDVAEAVREATGGGAHLSLDALGSPDTCYNSVANLRKRGRHVQVGLLVGENASTAVPFDRVVADELELRGTHGLQAYRYPALFNRSRSRKPETACDKWATLPPPASQ